VALPSNLTTVEVTGRYIDQAGAAVRGTVTFSLDTYLLNSGESVVLVESPVTVTLDATGSFAVDLATTDDPDVTPNGFTWTLTPNFDGGFPLTFALPANLGPTVDITVLAPALPNPDPVYSYVLTSAIGAPTGVAPLDSNGLVPLVHLGGITAAQIDSEAATNGFVLTADGTGGAEFVAATGGGGGGLPDVFMLMGA
jgi:hypothetical protein